MLHVSRVLNGILLCGTMILTYFLYSQCELIVVVCLKEHCPITYLSYMLQLPVVELLADYVQVNKTIYYLINWKR